jgi:hypothetical protein
VMILEQIASRERYADDQERRVIQAKQERRREKAKAYRESRKADGERTAAMSCEPETPPNRHSEWYIKAQARLSLPDHFREVDDWLLNMSTGVKYEATAQNLCKAVAGSLENSPMPTFTANAEPPERGDPAKPKPKPTPRRRGQETEPVAGETSNHVAPDVPKHGECCHCHQPAAHINLLGWPFCDRCWNDSALRRRMVAERVRHDV